MYMYVVYTWRSSPHTHTQVSRPTANLRAPYNSTTVTQIHTERGVHTVFPICLGYQIHEHETDMDMTVSMCVCARLPLLYELCSLPESPFRTDREFGFFFTRTIPSLFRTIPCIHSTYFIRNAWYVYWPELTALET